MFRHVVVVFVIYLRILCANSFEFKDIFNISDSLIFDNKNCTRSAIDSKRFFYKTKGYTREFPDVCDETDLSNLNYFPKCCPPGYFYETQTHACLLNDGNSTNIYEDFQTKFLVRSHLDCPVIIDRVISERSIIFHDDRSITFNGRLYDVNSYCVDWNDPKNSTILRTCENLSQCKINRCITKCCKDGSSYVGGKCVWNPEYGISVEKNFRFEDRKDDFTGVVQARKCGRFKDNPKYNFTIKPDGRLIINNAGKWVEFSFEENKYCLEYFTRENRHVVFICAFPSVVNHKIYIMRTLNIISCLSLIFTILGYLFLKELKNFLGKIIVCYCGCLLLATSFLTYGQFKPNDRNMCVPLAFLVNFFYLTTFAWMNVLSFEIWQVLGSMSAQYGTQLYNDKKKFIYYHLYAWSLPVLLLIVGVISYFHKTMPDSLKPVIGLRYCLIETNKYEENYGYYIFLAVPSLLYLLANAILFTKTIRYIFKVQNDVKFVRKSNFLERQRRVHIDKERVATVLRIFVIMGISWLLEFILIFQIDFSANAVLQAIETIFDLFNCLQGFFIFCVFMAKRKIFIAIRQKLRYRGSIQRNSTTEMIMSCNSK